MSGRIFAYYHTIFATIGKCHHNLCNVSGYPNSQIPGRIYACHLGVTLSFFERNNCFFIVRRTCSCEDYEVLYSLATVFSTKYFQIANSVKHSTIMDIVPECEPLTIVPEC